MTFPNAATIVRWYRNPNDPELARFVEEFQRPTVPYDFPVSGPRESIRFTMLMLFAATPPLNRGKPRPFEDQNRQASVFWPIFTTGPEDTKLPDPVTGTRTETVSREYGFDASGTLTVYIYKTESYESLYKDHYLWPDWRELNGEHLSRFMEELENFRRELSTH